jgi:hypothetical protein
MWFTFSSGQPSDLCTNAFISTSEYLTAAQNNRNNLYSNEDFLGLFLVLMMFYNTVQAVIPNINTT